MSALQITPSSGHLGYGHRLTVMGLAPPADGGYRLALEFSAGGGPWRTLSHTKVHSGGAFRLRAPLTRSGAVQVVPVAPPVTAPPPAPPTAEGTSTALARAGSPAPVSSAPPLAPSPPRAVAVAANLATPRGTIDVLAGQAMMLRGALLPRRRGAVVRLQDRARGRWRTVAAARTRAGGRFVLRHVDRVSGKQIVRVRFAGDTRNAAVSSRGREVISLHPVVASWYYDGGTTACGFHAGQGVASPDLPCGARVTFAYHGRTVSAVVDDRGPFVPGRSFDLNQSTAAALGFNGVDTVWSSL